jgi:endo-1,4-beta-xylanase
MRRAFEILGCSVLSLLAGCSESPPVGPGQLGTGGGNSTGGTSAAGGSSGLGGGALTGGSTGTGSATSIGGGTTASGGSTASPSGGTTPSAGGTGTIGGAPATGSAPPVGETGGSATGGTSTAAGPKFIGNVVHKNDAIIPDFADKWMQVTMEANAKWGFVQPDSATGWVWGPVDDVYEYAKEHDILYKQHNFVWNFEQPSWVTNANVATAFEAWVKAFCERYPDVPMIDVVNEPLTHAPPYKDGLGGDGASGYDWAVKAFQVARKYCPNAILLINDYNIIEWPNDHARFVTLLEKMIAAGAPIDAIGAQGHDVDAAGVDQSMGNVDDFTERFHLPIYITEFDIGRADDQEQLAVMQEAIPAFWDHPNIYGITYWGFQQGKMWKANSHLVRSDGTARPALTWLLEFVAAHR